MAGARPELFLRLNLGRAARLGPGKVALLEGIARTGSISAAGREMGMSYKRAWMLVEALNAMFAQPLVLSTRGGAGGGGAVLTGTGTEVLALFRRIEAEAQAANTGRIARLRALLAPELLAPELLAPEQDAEDDGAEGDGAEDGGPGTCPAGSGTAG